MINIVADENLAYPVELFSQFGDVLLINGRKITKSVLKNADALIIRSVTEVNESILTGTNIKFVGTATIGTDHIDTEYLASKGISFASAPGCNSYAVAEYVIAALLDTAVKNNFSLENKTIGVVGIGNVGSKVVRYCEALGMKVLKNDPPLFRQGKLKDASQLDDILESDILSLHVPLTIEGEDKTYHLIDKNKLKLLKDNTVLINTSRGAVVDNTALTGIIEQKNLKVILDVWENEPDVNNSLVKLVQIGTPHIAGYTLEGKVNGSIMVYEALAEFLGKDNTNRINLPGVHQDHIEYDFLMSKEEALNSIIKKIYNIAGDHHNFLRINSLLDNEQGKYFDTLRKEYPLRREFSNYSVKLNRSDIVIEKILKKLSFIVLH